MKHVKDGVLFSPCTPDLVDGIVTAAITFTQQGYTFVVTSGSDGIHPAGGKYDPHYLGYAFDVRTRDFKPHELPPLAEALRTAMGPAWRVIIESNHFHCQHQDWLLHKPKDL
jgi:hypothetical protein